MRPPFPYFGGKQTLAVRIVELLPPHQHYVEPYAGSLSVLLAKTAAKMETVNDLDHRLMTFWRVLREQPDELIRRCALTPHSRAEYLSCCEQPTVDGDDLETARRVWVILTQGRSGTMSSRKTGWRYFVDPHGSSIGMPGYLDGYVTRMAPVVDRLRDVSLECMPALDLIGKYRQNPDVLLMCDPPYLGAARSSNNDEYTHEMRSTGEHRDLAEALRAARAAVILCGYPSPLYDELYGCWDRMSMPASTGNGRAGGRQRTEVVWSNRPLGAQPALFDLTPTDGG